MIIPSQELNLPIWQQHDVQLIMYRLDLTHPHISGNKWFKLQPALYHARLNPLRPLLSFGGPFSNHLHALAYAGFIEGFKTLGIIRGEQHLPLNPTLHDMSKWGMRLHFVSRSEYAARYDPTYIDTLRQQFGDFQLIPEGGSNAEAVLACGDIWKGLSHQKHLPDFLACALGTGATVAGLIAGRPKSTHVLVMPALKISSTQAREMLDHHWRSIHYHPTQGFHIFDGDLPYARITPLMAALWQRLSKCYGVDLDPVYTLRVYHQLSRLLLQGYFPKGSQVALLHTGGLQGLRGCAQQIMQRATAFNGPLPV